MIKSMSVKHLLIPVFNICQIDMKIYSQVKLIVAKYYNLKIFLEVLSHLHGNERQSVENDGDLV